MEAQYYLELVDRKHRYASNLKHYHAKWNETDTSDNFFHVRPPFSLCVYSLPKLL